MPLEKPKTRRPTYKAAMLVVDIMMMLEIMHRALAIQTPVLREMMLARGPVDKAPKKAPRFTNDEIRCSRTDEIFHPAGTLGSG